MKVLILNTLFPPYRIGGAEKSVALLADGLARAGDEVTVATLHGGDRATEQHLPSGVHVHRLPMDNSYWPYAVPEEPRSMAQRLGWHGRNRWNRRAAGRIGRLIDRVRPDVVHCNVLTGFSAAVWPEIKKRGLPLVQTLRDYALICARAGLFKNGRQCGRRCLECRVLTARTKQASRAVDQLVSNSRYVLETHQGFGYFPDVPARRIFNIVPLDAAIVPAPGDAGPLAFGFIGRIEPEKGIEVVLAACARLRRPDWRLRVAGAGVPAYVEGLRRRYPDPRITWLGFSDPDSFYRSIDVVLIPSVWPEPLPRTLIEALSYGLSAICSSAGGTAEIAGLARLSALYEATDPDALASAMTGAIDDAVEWRRRGLRDAGCLDAFAEDVVVAQTREVYRDAVHARTTR